MIWEFKTGIGVFYIVERNGRFHPIFGDEDLGSYADPSDAADDLAGGHTFSLSSGVDTADLGIPDHISEWQRVR